MKPAPNTLTMPVGPFKPLAASISEVRNAIPAHLFKHNTTLSFLYLIRDLVIAAAFWSAATYIDSTFTANLISASIPLEVRSWIAFGLRAAAWLTYWWFQGLTFTGIWVIGHECGHGAFSSSGAICDIIGFTTHTLLFTPYFSWRISHHRHHANHASMERDEVYVPPTRSDLGIPETDDSEVHWEEYFADTPIYTLFRLIVQQLFAFPAYLFCNISGQKTYPAWTNHFDPASILFSPAHRSAVLISNAGMLSMLGLSYLAVQTFGWAAFTKFYLIPWLCVNHWFTMITYLHHTTPYLPHYRASQWTFARGAAATVDRNFLGWQGRFFLHDVAHFHVVHHFFPRMPWFNGEEATKHLKAFLGPHYMYDDAPVFQALWNSYNQCQFVDDKGDILFYRNKEGKTAREVAK